ncbi:Acetyl-CoA carboxylase, carboxyltransferase component [Lachnospiraceae bacterium XBB2008]|nr:Acetyl-CoA carboxylase, carboxyltransferase component [Lachnospiraceae bacterium XBB2008]
MSSTTQARARIDSLLDANSFVEIGAKVKARATDFNLKQTDTPSDGVVTGYGVIEGRLVYVYAQDPGVLGGSIGEMHAKKIAGLYDLALKTGAPIIGLIDSTGLRLEESTDALNSFAQIYSKQSEASGVIPQITAVFGNCGGGLAIAGAMSDFVLVEASKGKLFVNSPNAIEGNNSSKCDTSAADFQSEAGNVDVSADEAEVYSQIRKLIELLPSNNSDIAVDECDDDLNRATSASGDVEALVASIADNGTVFETRRGFTEDMYTALIRLGGATVGCIANKDQKMSAAGAAKAARFAEFCDAFDIPILTLTDVTGFKACKCGEKKLPANLAKLTFAFASATVPKINVYTGKAFGSAYAAMNSKGLGADMCFAWPDAEIGCMEADAAAKILASDKSADEIAKTASEYAALQNNVESAAARGYVDTIIEPVNTRKYLIGAFEMLATKAVEGPAKKHGTV